MTKRYLLIIPLVLVLACLGVLLYDEELTDETKAWLTPVTPTPDNIRGLELYREFNERTDAHRQANIAAGRKPIDNALALTCVKWLPECVTKLRNDDSLALRYMPRDKEYYEHYFEMLGHSIVIYDPQDVVNYPRQNIIQATRFSFMNDLLVYSAVQPDTAVTNLKNYRRLMAGSHVLIDKIIFAVAFSISIEATRMAMGIEHPWT